MPDSPQSVTQMLLAWSGGDRDALDKLIPIVYDQLRRQAASYLRRERVGHTLQTSALINEAYLRLVDQHSMRWQNRDQFFAIAAQMMRRILVDHAKGKHREKRGGSMIKVTLGHAMEVEAGSGRGMDLIALDQALDRLARIDEQQSRIVELRYFSGLSIEQTAKALGISPATVKRDWRMAKAWLRRELGGGSEEGSAAVGGTTSYDT
jgi:RNA polymerase sigma factor (TIGR02999 family)